MARKRVEDAAAGILWEEVDKRPKTNEPLAKRFCLGKIQKVSQLLDLDFKWERFKAR